MNRPNNTKRLTKLYNYRVVGEEYYNVDIGNYYSYGIEINYADGYVVINDISTIKEKVSNIVKLIKKYNVSPDNIQDIIEDMLS